MAETEEKLKSLLVRVNEESEKPGLTQHSKNKDHGIWSHYVMANRWRSNENSGKILFCWAPNSLQMVTTTMTLKDAPRKKRESERRLFVADSLQPHESMEFSRPEYWSG